MYVFIGIFIIILLVFIIKYINEIEKFEKVTREKLYDYELEKLEKQHIGRTPLDFGYEYEELEYKKNKKTLKAWFMKSEIPSKKLIFFVHGRKSNGTRNLKYLRIFKENNIKGYSIFIPDMRNSGESSKARTFMGYRFADDIKDWLEYLKTRYEIEEVVFYSFSMGAMASSFFMYKYEHSFKDILIKKMILDSPLANVRENITYNIGKNIFKNIFLKIVLFIFNLRIGGNLKKLSYEVLFKDKEIEILIFQSEEDLVTPYKILEKEIRDLKNMKVLILKEGDHVELFPKNEKEYAEELKKFLEE